ncbi:hypothetical protein MVEN_02399200 [Mycena venus]|uniref:F-box domain-containing protein n=1 Tax=Mycena venus TaxID=2733690 RepID=A0A8H6X255_9AGAR|nr:hypothetical protein MVEN_02399200 [Mycena venus]
MEIPQVPWSLGLVSKRWRDIALSLSWLWSSFGIHTSNWRYNLIGRKLPDESLSAIERVEEQLRRSGQTPLEVTIEGDFSRIPGALDTLRDACGRWETLSVRKTSQYLDHIRGRTPLLRRIYVASGNIGGTEPGPVAFEFSSTAPGLYDRATRRPMDPLMSFGNVDWAHLTRYDGPILWGSYPDLLRQATCLVECSLFSARETPHFPLPAHIFSLPSLRRLRVSSTHCLTILAAPGLQEFVVDGKRSPDEVHVIDFLTQSSCTLLRLSLFNFPATQALFLAVPSLQELTIEFNNGATMISLLENILPVEEDSDEPHFLPSLTALSIGDVARRSLSPAVKAISARFGTRGRYRAMEFFGMFVDISMNHSGTQFPLFPEDTKHLDAMQRDGVKLYFVKGKAKYDRMRMMDPYSMRRYAEYHNAELMTNESSAATSGIWDCA